MAEIATVYVYVQVQDPSGYQFWIRYVSPTTDHDAAATEAMQAVGIGGSSRIVGAETFDGPARRYDVGAIPVKQRQLEVVTRTDG